METFKKFVGIESYNTYLNEKYGSRLLSSQNNILKEQEFLYEGLIRSCNAEQLKNLFINIGISKNDIIITNEKNDYFDIEETTLFLIYVDFYNSEKVLEKIDSILKVSGWFISKTIKENNSLKVYLENKYNVEVTDIIQRKFSNILYHVSDSKNKDNIIRKGICAKAENKKSYHPERTYCFVDETNISDVSHILFPYLENDVSIFRINLNGYYNGMSKMRFFSDPNLYGGVYTLEYIHPNFIQYIGEANISNRTKTSRENSIKISNLEKHLNKHPEGI